MESTLAQAADAADCHVDEEACPLNLAPTASTTAALALGDALAMTLLARKGFRPDDSPTCIRRQPARFMRVERLMHAGDAMPLVRLDTPMRDLITRCRARAWA
jgi:arabinose-5-phosphate isomerase